MRQRLLPPWATLRLVESAVILNCEATSSNDNSYSRMRQTYAQVNGRLTARRFTRRATISQRQE